MSVSAVSRTLKAAVLFVSALVSSNAFAQKAPPRAPSPRSRNQSFNMTSSDQAASPAARARAKARADDCAGALPLFDEAVRLTIEPTLRRDRGACHDKLGNPTAAVEDYRAYLYARPEASDAKEVEERIQVLEGQIENDKKSSDDPDKGGPSASASLSINGEKTEGHVGGSGGADDKRASKGSSYDDFAARVKRRDEAETSPLRTGIGGIFGFYGSFRAFPTSFNGSNIGYSVGIAPRYAFTSYFTLLGELGFAGFGTRARQALGGPALWVGAEFRIKLDPYGSNHILLGAGPGYERYVGLDRTNESAFNTFHVRGRIGFRHVFGSNLGLEANFDPSVVFFSSDQLPSVTVSGLTVSTGQPAQGLISGNVSFVVGF
jgi:hypothetical protein